MKIEYTDILKILDDTLAESWLTDNELKMCDYNVNQAVSFAVHKIRGKLNDKTFISKEINNENKTKVE